MSLPRIAITMGDPAGIGPEICLKVLADSELRDRCVPLVFGDAEILLRVASACGLPEPRGAITHAEWMQSSERAEPGTVVDLRAIRAVRPGQVNAETGLASYRYLEAAIDAALAGQVDAVSTGPIHKEALHAAGIAHPGHTEILAEKTHTSRYCMMLTSPEITCSLISAHVGYREAVESLSIERIVEVILLSHDAMVRMRGREVRLVVCGLNPHAGEHGLFGEGEEEKIIGPAVAQAQAKGLNVEGPLPPDTAFLPEQRERTDCYICMYHDQGLIPLKAIAFDHAVNVTLGLPIVRTSVDHGTALDIAWTGRANARSLREAILLAIGLSDQGERSA